MDVRLEKARAIVKTSKVRRQGNRWLVPSQSQSGRGYVVTFDGEQYRCTCPDWEYRRANCKHALAVSIVLTQTEETTRAEVTTPDGAKTVMTRTTLTKTLAVQRPTYPQNWKAYNAAQTQEQATFLRLLSDLCAGIPEPPQHMGRKRIPLAERVFAATFKVYSTFSGRRFMTDLRAAHAAGYLSRVPHFNSIFNTLDEDELTDVLERLITVSSLPLAAVEHDFAVDSTGLTTSRFARWFDAKYGTAMQQHEWVKLHLICGVKTNIVTSVLASEGTAGDAPVLPLLVAATSRHFTLHEVSADKAYSSKANLNAVLHFGAQPYVPFKSNATGGLGPMTLWKRLYHFYEFERERFLAHYHKRSNVESTFHMIKSKFGDALRSKTENAQRNEALMKVLCHNLCVVIQSMHELGISPDFGQTAA